MKLQARERFCEVCLWSMKPETRERAKQFFKNIGAKTQSYGNKNQHLSIDCKTRECAEFAIAYAASNRINYDVGLMNTNSVHLEELAKYDITPLKLLEPNTSIKVGAWELSGCINRYGQNLNAINCYNGISKNNRYYLKVVSNYSQQRKM